MTSPTHLIAVETSIAPQADSVDPEEWYAEHTEHVRRIPGVVRVERYWSEEDPGRSRHLALYHLTERSDVMSDRFARAKAEGRLTSSQFPDRVMHSYRLHSVLAD